MEHRQIQQQRQLHKLMTRGKTDLNVENYLLHKNHKELLQWHTRAVEFSYAEMRTSLQEIASTLSKLASKPAWRFWA
jgi:hypothetical protein